MTKKNKIVLTSIGVIIPITILTITLPIVLVKKANDKKKLDALNKKKEAALKKEKEDALKILNNKKLKNLDYKIKNRILKFDVDLDLSKLLDRMKIIDEIEKLNKLTFKEKKLISVNVKNGIITNSTNNVEVQIAINSATTKDITFEIRINRVTLKKSNITHGQGGRIFQDSSGNIWSIGGSSILQVLEKGQESKGWQSSASGLTKGLKQKGGGGIIFQDSSENIWTSSYDFPLQVLRKDRKDEGWKIVNNKFYFSTIIQDKAGNIWATGTNTPLVALEKGQESKGWHVSTTSGLTRGSNIKKGRYGTIFQDASGNIWSMGNSKLQVLEKGQELKGWQSSTTSGLTKGSNIKNGQSGTIFQDVSRNIWSMGFDSELQVLKWEETKYADSWTNSIAGIGLTKGSNITRGESGKIFQDSSGNIWSMGWNSKLQVLERGKEDEGWQTDNSELTKGSIISNGINGTFFQDVSGNIWSMGFYSKLQVLEKGHEAKGWQSSTDSGLTKGSNIKKGQSGTIFQDVLGNIWSMSHDSELQVLKKGSSEWINK